MDPRSRKRTPAGSRFPRTRGDGPVGGALYRSLSPFPPHARGWTRPPTPNRRWLPVSPARAGMDPSPEPRESPDLVVSPARAGMDPCSRSLPTNLTRFPRTRGDGPAGDLGDVNRFLFPPHARGWTRSHREMPLDVRVSPARAGMDPPPSSVFEDKIGFPPHARGWTRGRAARRHPEQVSPARAGMDSNRPVGESGRVFGDSVVATAILERPLHRSHLITICGEATGFARSVAAASSGAPPASCPPPPRAHNGEPAKGNAVNVRTLRGGPVLSVA